MSYSTNLNPDSTYINSFSPSGVNNIPNSNFNSGLTIGGVSGGTITPTSPLTATAVVSDNLFVCPSQNYSTNSVLITEQNINYNLPAGSFPFLQTGFNNIGSNLFVSLDYIRGINTNQVISAVSNQMTVQQGEVVLSGTSNTVHLAQPFKDTTYSVSLTNLGSPAVSAPYMALIDNQSFDVYGDSNATIRYIAIGTAGVEY